MRSAWPWKSGSTVQIWHGRQIGYRLTLDVSVMSFLKTQGSRILAVIAFSPLLTLAVEIPDRVLPDGVGVNIHFTRGHQKDLDLIAAAGFRLVRTDFLWG